jgi:hypothetical protein
MRRGLHQLVLHELETDESVFLRKALSPLSEECLFYDGDGVRLRIVAVESIDEAQSHPQCRIVVLKLDQGKDFAIDRHVREMWHLC